MKTFIPLLVLLAPLNLFSSGATNRCFVGKNVGELCGGLTTNQVEVFQENLFPPSKPERIGGFIVCARHIVIATNLPARMEWQPYIATKPDQIVTFGRPFDWRTSKIQIEGRPETGWRPK